MYDINMSLNRYLEDNNKWLLLYEDNRGKAESEDPSFNLRNRVKMIALGSCTNFKKHINIDLATKLDKGNHKSFLRNFTYQPQLTIS